MKLVAWDQVRRLLICRTDHIGDLVVSTPVLRAFRERLPQARICHLVAPASRGLVEGSGWADEVITPDQLDRLRDFGADAAIGLSPRSATYGLLVKSGAPLRIGYTYAERPLSRLRCWWTLTHTWVTSLQKPLQLGLKVPHEAEVVAQFVEATGLGKVEIRPEFPLDPELLAWGREAAQNRPVLHFAPRWLESGWSLRDFLDLATQLAPIVVTFGPQERTLLPERLPELPGVEWRGDMSLKQWAALLGGARALISTDTGAVHIAAAGGTPVVVVHLPQHQLLCSQQWYPWGVSYVNLAKKPLAQMLPELLEVLQGL